MTVTTTSTTKELLDSPVLKSAISKASFRLMPMLVILYVVAFLDRTNVGFAEAALGVDKGITAGAYALGAGIFFIGYALFEIPTNLLLTKFGAKVWLARIAITWGIVSACFAFVQGETSFIILRFLLGVTEAGLFPGVIMFLAAWFPNKVRVKMFAIFYLAQPFSQMMGAPLSGWLINIGDQVPGVQGWQVMFFVEGMLAVLAGIAAYFFLINSPQDAKFLNTGEKKALLDVMALEDNVKEESGPRGVLAAMRNGKVWYFTVIYFCLQIAVYGVTFYLPQQVAQLTGQKVGFAVGMMAPSRGSSASSPATSSARPPTPWSAAVSGAPGCSSPPASASSVRPGPEATTFRRSASCSSAWRSAASCRSAPSRGPTRRRSSPEPPPLRASA